MYKLGAREERERPVGIERDGEKERDERVKNRNWAIPGYCRQLPDGKCGVRRFAGYQNRRRIVSFAAPSRDLLERDAVVLG